MHDHYILSTTSFYTALRGLPEVNPAGSGASRARSHTAMDDDFNTPDALAVLFDLAREINRVRAKDVRSADEQSAAARPWGRNSGP